MRVSSKRDKRQRRAMRRLRARAFGFVWLSAFAAQAQAPAPQSGLGIQVANCDPGFTARVPAVVKLEIDVLLRERGPTRSPPESIAVRCEEERARIEVTMEGSTRASTIDLHVLAAEHRARAVALAAAELVHAMSGQPRAPEVRASSPATPSISAAEPDRPASAASPLGSSKGPTLLMGGLAEWRGNPAALLFGGRMALQSALNEVMLSEFSVDASFGGISARSAHVAIRTFSTAAHLYFGTTTGNVRWDLGPGARFGSVHLVGQPDAGSGLQGESVNAVWGGPELRLRAAYRASQLRPALFAVQLGAGFVALPVRGLLDGTEPIYAVEGPWMSICAELGLGF
jgi:hypothetical protein